jgi:hypothetical protein
MKIPDKSTQLPPLVNDLDKLSLNDTSHRITRRSSGLWNQTINSSSRKNTQDSADHHEVAINLALKNKYPVIAEMILRDITLKDAVRGDEMNQLKRKVQQAITSNSGLKRSLESQSVEP